MTENLSNSAHIRVISSSGPLIHLAKINHLELLKELFSKIIIPKEVKFETVDNGLKIGAPDAILIRDAIEDKWIDVINIEKIPTKYLILAERFGIHTAELKVILYARDNKLVTLLDDLSARILAQSLSVPFMGSLGILVLSARKGIISKSDALAGLDKLARVMYLNTSVYLRVRDELVRL